MSKYALCKCGTVQNQWSINPDREKQESDVCVCVGSILNQDQCETYFRAVIHVSFIFGSYFRTRDGDDHKLSTLHFCW